MSPAALRRYAEFWLTRVGEDEGLWVNGGSAYIKAVHGRQALLDSSNPTRANLCLLEAEFLESEAKEAGSGPLVPDAFGPHIDGLAT